MTREHIFHGSITLRYAVIALCTASTILILLSSNKASAFTQNASPKSDYIISFRSNSLNNEYEIKFRNKSHSINEKYRSIPAIATSLTDNEVAQLRQDRNVTLITKDEKVAISNVRAQSTPSNISQMTDWGINTIGVNSYWNRGVRGKGVNVAVLDTGIADHSDLAISGGASFVQSEPSWVDLHGHGTHVAGIIAAKNNGIGTVGVASDINLYAVKVLSSQGYGTISDLIAGIDWSISNKMHIVNMSLGAPGAPSSQPQLKSVIDKAQSEGITVVASAGNNNRCPPSTTTSLPAIYSSVISVGAIKTDHTRACFSNTNSELDVVAPGVNIWSTWKENNYASASGTSMAAPHVAGLLALMKSENFSLGPKQLQSILENNTKDLGALGKDFEYGNGLVQPVSSDSMIRLSTNNMNFPAIVSGGQYVDVQRTGLSSLNCTNVQVTKNARWISYVKNSVEAPNRYFIFISRNTGGYARSGEVKFSCGNNWNSVYINQDA